MDDLTVDVLVGIGLLFLYMQDDAGAPAIVTSPGIVQAAPPGGANLPAGYATDVNVGYSMLVSAMNSAGLTSLGVQHRGSQIVAALQAKYPGLDVYLSPTDSPIWPGFGSLDVTIDSGKGGWEFSPDGYWNWLPQSQRY